MKVGRILSNSTNTLSLLRLGVALNSFRASSSGSREPRHRLASEGRASSSISGVLPWAIQPVVNLQDLEDGDLVQESLPLEARVTQIKATIEKKQQSYLNELQKFHSNEHAVFTNSEFSLGHINVYGFDFDYTLVQYGNEVHKFAYEQARDMLIKKLNYPPTMKGLVYDPDFAIRGLHCDSKNGLLMKIDAYNHIQPGSVYRGHYDVKVEELFELYGGLHVPMHVMDNLPTTSKWKLTHFLDMFSIPEATLFADVSQFLLEKNISYDPENLFEDVQRTFYNLHISGQIHNEIASDHERYLLPNYRLTDFLHKLKNAGKQLFIISNSPYWFIDALLKHQLHSKRWSDLFDVIIVGAKKPSFYSDSHRPFRCLNSESMTPTWTKVTELVPGKVYQQGNVKDLVEMMQWQGKGVLYFGDHVFSDLADPILQQGWKTGAIIPELEKEIQHGKDEEFKYNLSCMLALESVLKGQNVTTLDEKLVSEWKSERNKARRHLKEAHNIRFGSVFRTEKSPTYFSRRLASFSNLYTSSLENLLQYPLNHTFIPRRAALPHEPDLNFDL